MRPIRLHLYMVIEGLNGKIPLYYVIVVIQKLRGETNNYRYNFYPN